MHKIVFSILSLICLNALAADPVSSDRLPYGGTFEGITGVSGGIPVRSDFTNLTTSATASDINNAVSVCPSNQNVRLASGNFTIGADVTVAKSGVTLIGAVDSNGNPTTTLVFGSGFNLIMRAATWDIDSPGAFTTRTVSTGATRGSTTLTLTAAPTGLTAGRMMWITAPEDEPTIDGAGGWTDWFGSTDNHPFSQAVEVTGVSGNDVSYTPAINADYISGLTCKVHYRAAANQVDRSGVENIICTNSAGSFSDGIVFRAEGANQCWLQNVHSWKIAHPSTLNAHTYLTACRNFEIRRCRFSGTTDYGSSSYGMASLHCSGLLIEDNVFTDLPNVWPMLATSGSAFANNYIYYLPYDDGLGGIFLSQGVFHHGSHNHYNLMEANWLTSAYHDASDSGNFSHSKNTVYLRNRMLGWDEYPDPDGKEENTHPITADDHHDDVVLVGNVMGVNGVQTQYDKTHTGGTGGTPSIYNMDTTSRATLFRKGNYNTVNDTVPAGEALGGGEVIPDSYLHSSKPAWMGGCPFPWIVPTDFTQSNTDTNLQAAHREIHGADRQSSGNPFIRSGGGLLVRRGGLGIMP